MDGLPGDFASNSGLAAIASLLNDNEDEEKDDEKCTHKDDDPPKSTIVFKSGGGKVKKTSKRDQNSQKPYAKKGAKNTTGGANPSLGEAQLFMSMWKL